MDDIESKNDFAPIMPFSKIVGQDDLKLALAVAYVAGHRIDGVLASGCRGTGKSTIVRAFSRMMYGTPPVTLPINATEDRVVGGWEVDSLMKCEAVFKHGLLVQADGKILYVDEVNLLDDHIVNIILDACASGMLEVQRQGIDRASQKTRFILVGTMNPEESPLRPQLMDRFGLVVVAKTEYDRRREIVETVLAFDEAVECFDCGEPHPFIEEGFARDEKIRADIESAKEKAQKVEIDGPIMRKCADLAKVFEAEGHRGDYILALAARACAALEKADKVSVDHLKRIAPLALAHRRKNRDDEWTEEDRRRLAKTLDDEQ